MPSNGNNDQHQPKRRRIGERREHDDVEVVQPAAVVLPSSSPVQIPMDFDDDDDISNNSNYNDEDSRAQRQLVVSGLDKIVELLRVGQQQGNVKTVVSGFRKFITLLERGIILSNSAKELCELAFSQGLHVIVMSTMRRFAQDYKVQKFGCTILGQIAFEDRSRKIGIVNAGAIESIITAMNARPTKLHHQGSGLSALSTMLGRFGKQGAPADILNEAHRLVYQLDGVDIILRPMKQNPDHQLLQQTGVKLLFRLIFLNKEFKSKLMAAVSVVGLALEKHGEADEEIKEWGVKFINKVFSD